MSFLDCIVNGRTEGNLNDDQAKLASDLFIELETEYSGSMNRGQAQAQAAKDTFDALKRISIEKKRKKLLQVQAFKNIEKNLNRNLKCKNR